MKISMNTVSLFFVGATTTTTTLFVDAFQQPTLAFIGRTTTGVTQKRQSRLFAQNAEEAIREAEEASKKFGANSSEARLAWEVVEEIDSRDNSAAYTANESNQMSEEDLKKAQEEFESNLKIVERLTKDLKYHQKHMNDVAREMQALKLSKPENRPAPKSPQLEQALTKAKAMSAEFGNKSPEARLAWEEVEEIASAGLENAMGGNMAEECWIEAAEHCLALEELDRFINYEAITEGGVFNF